MNVTDQALVNIILFFFLPVWGVSGYLDWYCHKKSKIEETSGIGESLLHSLMGLQIGIPIILCLLFKVNALILIICLVSLVLHEVVAYCDVKLAKPLREISILEMQAHAYLSTTPLFIFLMIIAINWDLVANLLSTGSASSGQFSFIRTTYTFGGQYYLLYFALFMIISCVIPYVEEIFRCLRFTIRRRS